jgi:hypothetical protein
MGINSKHKYIMTTPATKNSNSEFKTLTFKEWLKREKSKWNFVFTYVASIGVFVGLGLKIPAIINLLVSYNISPSKFRLVFHIFHLAFILVVLVSIQVDKYIKFRDFKKNKVLANAQAEKENKIWRFLTLSAEKEELEILDSDDPNSEEYKKIRIDDWINYKNKKNKVVEQFTNAWFLCWMGWAALYIYLIFDSINSSQMNSPYTNPILNFFNNFSSLMIAVMFVILNEKTTRERYLGKIKTTGFLIVLILAIAEYGFSQQYKTSNFAFSLISGFIASITMAAVFGRLNNQFINIRFKIIVLLYLYAAIQVLFVFQKDTIATFLFGQNFNEFSNHVSLISQAHESLAKLPNDTLTSESLEAFKTNLETIKMNSEQLELAAKNFEFWIGIVTTSMYAVAFLLKVLFFFVVRWILQTARLTYFIVQESSLHDANKNDYSLKKFAEKIEFDTVRDRD